MVSRIKDYHFKIMFFHLLVRTTLFLNMPEYAVYRKKFEISKCNEYYL
jgi:hypothetical protein